MPDTESGRRGVPDIVETNLPGMGIRFEFTTDAGERLAVVHHRGGRKELVLYRADDPDCVARSIPLADADGRALREILGGSRVAEDLSHLRQSVEGLAIDWLPIQAGSPYAGKTIGDTAARTRTGVSIVAVLRGESPVPAPGPDQRIEAGDKLVVVGTARGIERLNELLRAGR